MIRPLRVRHRWLLAVLFALLFVAVALIVTFPPPVGRVERLPAAVSDEAGQGARR